MIRHNAFRISTGELTTFNINELSYAAPAVAPGGQRFFHNTALYDSTGNKVTDLNLKKVEHSCIGKLPNGNDAYYAIAFEEGSQRGCIGDILAHDLETGKCFPL